MKVVFDTNIYISALAIPGGRAEEAYRLARRGEFPLFTSMAILAETAQKLKDKFGWPEVEIARFLRAVAKVGTILKTHSHLHILADEPDNRILECALAAEADYIITGDKHLLSLKRYGEIPIIRLAEFLKLFEKE